MFMGVHKNEVPRINGINVLRVRCEWKERDARFVRSVTKGTSTAYPRWERGVMMFMHLSNYACQL